MNSPEIKEFILNRSHLFWYTPKNKKEEISREFLVEVILNYGTLDDVRELSKLLGKKEIAQILKAATGRKRMNYLPEIYNFFSIVFSKYE
jgi:hypothetical protein